MDNSYFEKKECRICGSNNLVKYFNLGKIPLVNSLRDPKDESIEEKFPLEVMLCNDCFNSQLSIVVKPEIMFSNYLYHSSVSKTFKEHCTKMTEKVKEIFNGGEEIKILDIASNDGCLLNEFKEKGFKVLGIEPAKNLSETANSKGITTINEFWNSETSKKVVGGHGKMQVITATNVLAHVDDINMFIGDVYETLSDDGVFIAEFPYMANLVKYDEFDTIYHEHLSYFLVKPLMLLFNKNNLQIYDIGEFGIHGGTIRIYAGKDGNKILKKNQGRINEFIENETKEGLYTIEPYRRLEENANKIKSRVIENFKELKSSGSKIAGYGASAKGNVFLNFCGLTNEEIDFIIDDTPQKQGFISPGSQIPIKSREFLNNENVDYLMLLAWNFAEELMKKTEEFKLKGGKYILAIPEMKII
ncbi:MAG: class I SAM-dependent methyltransferase [Candidatus Woesearchaeota archaeon]|jgi:hypothetical protein|nr:class I SAM-dependent methyltransferase [Candidatus Woesearchaeota archaeon]